MYDFHNIALAPAETLLLNAAILSVIVFALLKAERRLDENSGWIMLALLAVFAFAGRILFEPLPNIQPVTLIVLLAGIYLGLLVPSPSLAWLRCRPMSWSWDTVRGRSFR